GRRLQSRLLNELELYEPLVTVLARVAPDAVREDIRTWNRELREVIDQSVLVSHKNPQVAFTAADAAVARQLEHLESLDDPSDGRPIFVPDANALVRSPELNEWVFAGVPSLTS